MTLLCVACALTLLQCFANENNRTPLTTTTIATTWGKPSNYFRQCETDNGEIARTLPAVRHCCESVVQKNIWDATKTDTACTALLMPAMTADSRVR